MSKLSLLVIVLLSTLMPIGGGAAVLDESACPKLVMAHWMPQLSLPAFGTHKEFRDLPLIGPMQFCGDPIQQMREAKAAGIDAFSICSSEDLGWCKGVWSQSIEAADLIDGFFVCPAICNGLDAVNTNRDVMLAATIEWVKAAKGHRSPLRVAGMCVISSYNWGQTTKEQILEFRKKVKEATGEEMFLMVDIDGTWFSEIEYATNIDAYPEHEKAVCTLASACDMTFLFWPRRLLSIERAAKISKDAGILFAGATAPGYWRPEHEIFVPYNFTSRLRGHLASNIQYGVRWLHLTTWNDYSENTHVQPSANWGDTRASIVMFYGNLFKGIPIKETRFFVSSPSEARLGIPFGVEALVLQPAETPCSVTARLVDGRGQECGRWVGTSAAAKDSAVTPEFTLTAYPQGRFVRPIVDFQTAGSIAKQIIGAPIAIWPDVDRGLINRQILSVSDRSAAKFDEVSLSFAEEESGKGLIHVNLNPRVKGGAEFEPWAEVHLLAGDIVLKRILRNESLDLNWPVNDFPTHWRHYVFPRTYKCGFVTPRLVTMNGRIAYGDPLWIAPLSGEDLTCTANIPMTEIHDNAIMDKSLFSNHLKISGDVKAVHLITEPQNRLGLWVSPAARIEMHPNTLPTGPFTVKLSLKPDAIEGIQAVIDNTDAPGCGNIQFRLSILPDGKLQFIRDNFESVSTSSVVAGQWNDVSVRFDGKTFAFMIEGKADGEKTLDTPSTSDYSLFYETLNIRAGRINPRLRTAIAGSYSGGIAEFSIISGSDLAPNIRPSATDLGLTCVGEY